MIAASHPKPAWPAPKAAVPPFQGSRAGAGGLAVAKVLEHPVHPAFKNDCVDIPKAGRR